MTDPFGTDLGGNTSPDGYPGVYADGEWLTADSPEMLGMGEPTDAVRVVTADGTVLHVPDPGPPVPHMLWTGELTPDWVAFARRGNGPYWVEGNQLVLSEDTESTESVRVAPGEWVTWLGPSFGYEQGRVYPVFLRTGWEHPESLVGWIMEAADMPGLLRMMADNWLPDGYEVTIDTTSVRATEGDGK